METQNKNSAPTMPMSAPKVENTPDIKSEVAKPETVTVSAEAFAAVMEEIAKLKDTQALMLQVEDKNKIQKIEELRRSGKLVKSVKIRKYNGKYIVGWKTIQDEVYKDEQGRLIEKQTVELWYDDSSKSQMSMRQWANAPEYVPFEVTRESRDGDGNLFFVVVAPDGKTIEINASFIN